MLGGLVNMFYDLVQLQRWLCKKYNNECMECTCYGGEDFMGCRGCAIDAVNDALEEYNKEKSMFVKKEWTV